MRERRHAEVARKRKASGLDDLPIDVAVAIECQASEAEKVKPADPIPVPDSVDDLIKRLIAIRERLFWLHAVWATTLSRDVALESDKYRKMFQDLGERLKAQDCDAFNRLVTGHEALLFAKPVASKPTVPLVAQRRYELMCELQSMPAPKSIPKPSGYVPDGLQSFL
jgi:hypothetical protein